jgi:hypothetical protein
MKKCVRDACQVEPALVDELKAGLSAHIEVPE